MDVKHRLRWQWTEVAPAWERWHSEVRVQTAAATEWLLELAGIREGARVLDLASGVGEPALNLARRVGPRGQVIASDLLTEPLAWVERAAREQGLSSLHVAPCNMESLPFEDASFDAVTCRFGLMFCERLAAALAEVRRVLVPGGRAAFVVWGPRKQPLFEHTLGALCGGLNEEVLFDGDDDAPGPFRFARGGSLAAALEQAGFCDVDERTRTVRWPFAGSAQQFLQMFTDLAGPELRAGLDSLGSEARAALVDRAVRGLDTFRTADGVDPGAVLIGARAVR